MSPVVYWLDCDVSIFYGGAACSAVYWGLGYEYNDFGGFLENISVVTCHGPDYGVDVAEADARCIVDGAATSVYDCIIDWMIDYLGSDPMCSEHVDSWCSSVGVRKDCWR